MKRITLRFSNEKLSTLVYDSEAVNQLSFETIRLTDPMPVGINEEGILLNGRKYSHKLYAHNEIEFTITTDELSTNAIEFLKSYYLSNYQYISLYSSSWGNYIKVITEGGKFPLDYQNDIKYLPEIKMKLIYEDSL
ncbi:MAG: hypothetical protein KIT33_12580 [Candidatus Kapabacteria bacterium]|nr:hypothetical protein [Ignavibacteriota bacterium]MCW5885796.1 hypothetical protein [Candidatus Kapabacteria bacterium]